MKKIAALSVFLLIGWVGYAQETEVSAQVPISFSTEYMQAAREQAVIYSGREQIIYPAYYIGHPYLVSTDFVKGTIVYDGIQYPNLRMRLDLYRNELIVSVPHGSYNVVLQPDKLNTADFHSYRLFYHYPDGLKGSPGEGYCILLDDGACRVIEKPIALLLEKVKDIDMEVYFEQSSRFYILKEDVYYAVKSKSGVLKVFKTHKKELNRFAKQQQLDFKKETGKSIVALVNEYERLTKQP